MAKKILLINEGCSDNLGDQAIRESAQHELEARGFDVQFADFTRDSKTPARCSASSEASSGGFQVKMLLPKKLRWFLKHGPRVKRSLSASYEGIVIGGGQLVLSNGHFPIAFFTWCWMATKLFKIPVHIVGVGVASHLKPLDRWLYKKCFAWATQVYVRDKASKKRAEELGSAQVGLLPDWAFAMARKIPVKNDKPTDLLIGVTDLAVYHRYQGPSSREAYYQLWWDLIAPYLQENRSVKLFYTTSADALECQLFQQYLQQKASLNAPILETPGLPELVEVLQGAQTVVSGRMHALILGKVYCPQIVAFPISDKLKEFDQEYNSPTRTSEALYTELSQQLETISNVL